MSRNIDYRRGLRRLWILFTVVWFLVVALNNIQAIAFWTGYRYALVEKTGSFRLAAAEDRRLRAIIAACWAARRTACSEPKNPYDETVAASRPEQSDPATQRAQAIATGRMEALQGCERSQPFVDVLRREAQVRNITEQIENGDACADLYTTTTPDASGALIVGTILAPLAPIFVYLIGGWILRGFSKPAL